MSSIHLNRTNNFDLLRILAALQVVFHHGIEHLKLKDTYLNYLSDYFFNFFPGVPIFFFISGFLIYWSYERNSKLKVYFKNRVLRIIPALYFCLIITITILLCEYPYSIKYLLSDSMFWVWIIGQLTLFQFYTPQIFEYWGLGTPNGSLWSISVEIQFYLLIPIIYIVLRKFKKHTLLIFLLIITSHLVINYLPGTLLTKIARVTLINYMYYFMYGIYLYKNWNKLKKYIENKFVVWLAIYVTLIVIYFNAPYFKYLIDNTPLKILADIMLVGVSFSFAFSFKSLSGKVLKGNDISYGVYIYHILVINFMIQRGLLHKPIYLLIVFSVTIALAFLSWRFIEKPSLKLKYKQVKIFNRTF